MLKIFLPYPYLLYKLFFFFNKFIYFWLCWVFVSVRGLLFIAVCMLLIVVASLVGVRASHCGGFSCCRAQALGAWASVVVARGLSSSGSRALEHRLSSCGTWA